MESLFPSFPKIEPKIIHNSFYIPQPPTEEQESRWLRYWRISKPNYVPFVKTRRLASKKEQ